MKDAQIIRLIRHANNHATRARLCIDQGDRDQARIHTQRAQRALDIVSQARASAAVSQFIK